MTENLPTPWAQPLQPIAYDPSADYTLRRIFSGSHREGRRLLLINMPTQSEKHQLANRLRTIGKALKLWNTDDVVRAISRMLSCFEQYLHETGSEVKGAAHKKIAAKWAMEMQGLPDWAVTRACDAIRAGTVADVSKDFPPSIPRVRDLAESYCAEYRAEQEKISDALQGQPFIEPPAPEERERIKGKFKTFAEAFRADVEREGKAAEDGRGDTKGGDGGSQAAILGHYRAIGVEPVSIAGILISPELLRQLGRDPSKHKKRASQKSSP